jgi:hypothetical protein
MFAEVPAKLPCLIPSLFAKRHFCPPYAPGNPIREIHLAMARKIQNSHFFLIPFYFLIYPRKNYFEKIPEKLFRYALQFPEPYPGNFLQAACQ